MLPTMMLIVLGSSVQNSSYTLRLQSCHDGDPLTIHGFWPETKEWCRGAAFDPGLIHSLQPDLNTWWPSCEDNTTLFHEHEWLKHGTCSPWNEHDYFALVLHLRSQYSDARQTCFDANLKVVSCS